LLKTNSRSEGGQRYYTDADVVYLNRIAELKELDFSLNEIRSIILMGSDDATGEKRRNELLKQYRSKLSEALERQAALEKRVSDLTWHVQQLETNDDFQQCPGLMCKNCTFRERCRFKELS
ncbi:MAG: MerR family transcriptional regulator, partial [Sphaerochaeta sp.]|nr:MerR family transcriptional regulator [Sphaerochaeta sp.]